MQAFDYWQEQVREILKGSEVSITMFQLNPMRLAPITKQWHPKFQQIFMMPNRHQRLLDHDMFIDFGSLLLRENFGNQPMIDFFFEALSIDSESVPLERKRIKYKLPENSELNKKLDQVFNVIKSQGKPILLFHHKSTSPIRQMSDERARQCVRNILDNSDYFVISACGLELSDKRFMDLQSYSKGIDGFASIISRVNSIITVDTSTYHMADAFNIPTVVLFTSIEPEYRIKYYPYVRGIMLEEKSGPLYGRHKMSKKQEAADKELKIVDERFEKLDIKKALKELESIKEIL
jgi:ADP-heptose:LPS heptosyltransferase